MDQLSFSEAECAGKRCKTRHEQFLEEMGCLLLPWRCPEAKVRLHYHRNKMGRRPYPLEVMLRVHCLRLFYNLSDPLMKDSLYEIESMRRFAKLRLRDRILDETTILNFRHLLEKHGLGRELLDEINADLASKGCKLSEGTIVDATLISAPSSTKNRGGKRDEEMHQTKKGRQWYFGMKLHIGADAQTDLVPSAVGTAANMHDVTMVSELLHGGEKRVHGDAGYAGVHKRNEHKERGVEWYIAVRPGKRRGMEEGSKELEAEKPKASIRARAEHPFYWVKAIFGYRKVRYCGIHKDMNRLYLLLGFANLMRSRKLLLAG